MSDLLAGYGSDDSSGDGPALMAPASAPVTKQKSPPKKAVSALSATAAGGKKKKKLDVTFLPPEIQAALARRDTASSDSDSDVDAREASFPGKASGNATAKSILDRLPKPVHKDDVQPPGSQAKSKSNNPSLSLHSNSSVSSFGFDPDLESSFSSRPQANAPLRAVPASSWVNEVQKSTYVKTTINAAPPTGTAPGPALPGPDCAEHNPSSIYTAPSVSSSSNACSSILTSSASQPDRHPDSYSAGPSRDTSSSIGKNSRKREREIQLELMNGNVSVVEGTNFAEISTKNMGWDSSKYNEQQKREQEIQSMFSFGAAAGDKMIAQPTKAQNRKHQINALAMQAAQVELELMEARGVRSKSKSETQMKYGW